MVKNESCAEFTPLYKLETKINEDFFPVYIYSRIIYRISIVLELACGATRTGLPQIGRGGPSDLKSRDNQGKGQDNGR